MRHKPTLTQEEKLVRMTESPLPGLIFSLAVPTIVSMLITSFYNMADTFFIAKLADSFHKFLCCKIDAALALQRF